MATVAQATKYMLRQHRNLSMADVVARLKLPDIQNNRDLKARLRVQGTTFAEILREVQQEDSSNYLTITLSSRSKHFGPSRTDSNLIYEKLRWYSFTHEAKYVRNALQSITYRVGPINNKAILNEIREEFKSIEFLEIEQGNNG